MDNRRIARELVTAARELVGRQRIITRGKWPNAEFIVGKFYYKVEEETVTVTKDTPSGIESVAFYDYTGKGKKKPGERRPSPSADWEFAEEMAWRMAQKQSRA